LDGWHHQRTGRGTRSEAAGGSRWSEGLLCFHSVLPGPRFFFLFQGRKCGRIATYRRGIPKARSEESTYSAMIRGHTLWVKKQRKNSETRGGILLSARSIKSNAKVMKQKNTVNTLGPARCFTTSAPVLQNGHDILPVLPPSPYALLYPVAAPAPYSSPATCVNTTTASSSGVCCSHMSSVYDVTIVVVAATGSAWPGPGGCQWMCERAGVTYRYVQARAAAGGRRRRRRERAVKRPSSPLLRREWCNLALVDVSRWMPENDRVLPTWPGVGAGRRAAAVEAGACCEATIVPAPVAGTVWLSPGGRQWVRTGGG